MNESQTPHTWMSRELNKGHVLRCLEPRTLHKNKSQTPHIWTSYELHVYGWVANYTRDTSFAVFVKDLVCCSELQQSSLLRCVALCTCAALVSVCNDSVCCSELQQFSMLCCAAPCTYSTRVFVCNNSVCCSVLQRCSVLQCFVVDAFCVFLWRESVCCRMGNILRWGHILCLTSCAMECVAVYCSVLQWEHILRSSFCTAI